MTRVGNTLTCNAQGCSACATIGCSDLEHWLFFRCGHLCPTCSEDPSHIDAMLFRSALLHINEGPQQKGLKTAGHS